MPRRVAAPDCLYTLFVYLIPRDLYYRGYIIIIIIIIIIFIIIIIIIIN